MSWPPSNIRILFHSLNPANESQRPPICKRSVYSQHTLPLDPNSCCNPATISKLIIKRFHNICYANDRASKVLGIVNSLVRTLGIEGPIQVRRFRVFEVTPIPHIKTNTQLLVVSQLKVAWLKSPLRPILPPVTCRKDTHRKTHALVRKTRC